MAIGRDYADVPPTRGVYKGGATSTLEVSVEVTPSAALPTHDPSISETSWTTEAIVLEQEADLERQRLEQQQQQQQ